MRIHTESLALQAHILTCRRLETMYAFETNESQKEMRETDERIFGTEI